MFENPTIGDKKWYAELYDAHRSTADITCCLTLKRGHFDRQGKLRKHLYASFASEKEAEAWEKKNGRAGKLTRVFVATVHDHYTSHLPEEGIFDLEMDDD